MLSRSIVLLLVFSSCAPLFNGNRLPCVVQEGGRNSVFGVSFNDAFAHATFQPSKSVCIEQLNAPKVFRGVFAGNMFQEEDYKRGNSVYIILTMMDIKSIDKKYKTNKQLQYLLQATIAKRVLEMQNNTNSRFSNVAQKNINDINNDKVMCRTLFESVRDSKAANLPKGTSYLLMQSLYKSCVIIKNDIMIDVAFSIRTNPKDAEDINTKTLEGYMDNFLSSFIIEEKNTSISSHITQETP